MVRISAHIKSYILNYWSRFCSNSLVSGFRCQESELKAEHLKMDSLIKAISCLTTGAAGVLQPCVPRFSPMDLILGCHCVLSYAWHLTPRMKLRLTGTVKRLNVEHRTSNIEHRILMTLRFIDFKTSESRWRRDLKTQNFEGWIRSRSAGACAACRSVFF